MRQLFIKHFIVGLVCMCFSHASHAIARNYTFTQKGFTGGGEIVIRFYGEDKNGGINGLQGNLQNPDGKIGIFDCQGNRPKCDTYHQDTFDKEMAVNFTLTGSPLFQRAGVALARLKRQDFDATGFFDLETNQLTLSINLGHFGAPSHELNIKNDKSTVCEYIYDSNFNGTKQCETSSQLATIAGPPLFMTWTPGSAATLQPPSTLSLIVNGLSTDINVPAGISETGGGLVEMALTKPTVPAGKLLTLDTITILYEAPLKSAGDKEKNPYFERAIFDRVDVWDGNQKLFSTAISPWPKQNSLFKNQKNDVFNLKSNMREVVTLPANTKINSDVKVSLHLVNQCVVNNTCTAQKITLKRVGAGFNTL